MYYDSKDPKSNANISNDNHTKHDPHKTRDYYKTNNNSKNRNSNNNNSTSSLVATKERLTRLALTTVNITASGIKVVVKDRYRLFSDEALNRCSDIRALQPLLPRIMELIIRNTCDHAAAGGVATMCDCCK